ncbi:MAG: efflux RND transporter periplasmic adaptor subunit [Deltaproteobacteria bacterium]|nr:efflux RND transporter periplasmic adaptor subunit [Deltaproteobacteria bacterium]MBW2418214.1 efflux RND transporter periplasmic adaptor subunit [Deltaproteobacteria bacterium]
MSPSKKKILIPVIVLLLALGLTVVLASARKAPESNRTAAPPPLVQTLRVEPSQVQFRVRAQGTVAPRTESDLVTEAAGRILAVSPRLLSGAFFEPGDRLVRIDPRDYEASLAGARAAVARGKSQLALARSSLERERSMGRGGASSQAKLDSAIHAEKAATAGLEEARVALRRAELNLERTDIRAPFAGRVREKFVDVGQFVGTGARLARIYAVDYAEIRLPIPDDDLAYLDLPLGYRDDPLLPEVTPAPSDSAPLPRGPEVILSARFAGRQNTWRGQIVRTEGALDPETRMVTAVARVDDPYARGTDSSRPPLAVGLFVHAEILGKTQGGLVAIPRSALRPGGEVLVVDDEDRLRIRRVEIARAGAEQVWLKRGIEAGERICLTPLAIAVEGMRVRTEPLAAAHTASARSEENPL